MRAGGIEMSTTLCDERHDDNPRAGASMIRVGPSAGDAGAAPAELAAVSSGTRACLRHLDVV
jgi:hypothetical protein